MKECTDRRYFLKLLAAGSAYAALGGCASGAGGATPAPIGDVPAGNVSSLSVGDLRPVDGQAVAIGRDAQGVYALSLTCTHQGCIMNDPSSVSSSGIYCPCHGSQFDVNGAVVHGPANAPLEHYDVTADASGNLTIHGETVVASNTRLNV